MFFVTGASGFIGKAVVDELIRRKLPVCRVSRRPLAPLAGAASIAVSNYRELSPEKPNDVLVHLAEPADMRAASDNGNHAADMEQSMRDILSAPWGHIVYASSAAVYGDERATPRRTSDATHATSPYQKAKLACERLAIEVGGSVARLSNVYGPGMTPATVVHDILRQIPGTEPVRVRDTTPVRDYLWIEDAASALADLAERRATGVFNVGTGRGTSVDALAREALAIADEEHREVVSSAPSGHPSNLVLDISGTTKSLGWRPALDLRSGLSRMMN